MFLSLALFPLFILTFFLAGGVFSRWLPREFGNLPKTLLLHGAGTLLCIVVAAVLAMGGRLTLSWFLPFFLPLVLLGAWQLWRTQGSPLVLLRWGNPGRLFTPRLDRMEVALLGTVAVCVALLLIRVLTPTEHGDALLSYVQQIFKITQTHALTSAYHITAGKPHNVFLLGAVADLVSEAVGQTPYQTTLMRLVYNFVPQCVALLVLGHITYKEYGRKAMLLALTLLLSVEAILFLAQTGKIFICAFGFEMLFLFCLYEWLKSERSDRCLLIWSGVFLAAALGSKWHTYLNGPALLALFAVLFFQSRDKGAWLKDALAIGLVLLALGFVWNIYFGILASAGGTSNPFQYMDDRSLVLRNYQGFSGFFEMLWEFSARKEVIPNKGSHYGPLLLLFAPFLPFAVYRERNNTMRLLFLYAIIYFFGHYIVRQSGRDALLPIAIFAMWSTQAYGGVMKNTLRKEVWLLFHVVFWVLVLGTVGRQIQNHNWNKRFHYIFSQQSAEDYYDSIGGQLYPQFPDIPVERHLLEISPERKVVPAFATHGYFELFLEDQGFEIPHFFFPLSDKYPWKEALREAQYFILNKDDVENLSRMEQETGLHFERIAEGNRTYLYKVTDSPDVDRSESRGAATSSTAARPRGRQ